MAHSFDYDLIVIGGGSGGLACSKVAATQGKKVAVLDFVKPSPQGSQWGLGGTCVNVGCIPKKLFHAAGNHGESISDSRSFGWEVPEGIKHNWDTLVSNVQGYISSLNFGYRTELRTSGVKYINEYARFIDANTVETTSRAGKVSRLTSQYFVVAVGGRPRQLPIAGSAELCITSDDLFSLSAPPGKTLVVGASYIALESAGLLNALGYDTTVMVRSLFLRGFDQECAEKVAEYMGGHGVKFLRSCVPSSITAEEGGRKRVVWKDGDNNEASDVFDTVVVAIGRDPCTADIGLANIGVQLNEAGKIIGSENEQTSVPNIFAIGDVLHTPVPAELTPVAIKQGRLLADRLFGGSQVLMNYAHVPTTIFTPLEYSCVGLSEEAALAQFGADNVEVYHTHYKPLEWTVPGREDNAAFMKIITHIPDAERVVGLHIVGPNTGEIMQGFAVAIRCGATKAMFDSTVGIHPTTAEECCMMKITKRSGLPPFRKGC